MTRQLTLGELVAFYEDTHYLDAGIPVFGSRVAIWTQNNNMPVLIYHTKDFGYTLTDISSLGQSTINELAKQSDVHGMWYYLPTSVQEVISEDAEQVADIAASAGSTLEEILKRVAETTGKTLQNLIAPLVEALMVPLVIVGVVLGIYLIKKG